MPESRRAQREIKDLAAYGCGTVMHLIRLIAPRLPDVDQAKDMDFHSERIQARWQAGLRDGRKTLAQQAWLAPVDPVGGLFVHDIGMDDATLMPI